MNAVAKVVAPAIGLGLFAVTAATAAAATIRVPADEPTIQAAVEAAEDGDTIRVSPGIYREQVSVSGKNDLRFSGSRAVWTGNVDGLQGTALTVTGHDIVVQGFIFRHGGGHVRITGDRAVVQRCTSERGEFEDNEFSFVRIDGNEAVVERCVIRDAAEPAIHVFGNDAEVSSNRFGFLRDPGIVVEGNGAVVERNRFERCNVMAVSIEGTGATVERNQVAYAGVMAIHVEGDGVVQRNRIGDGGGVAGICVDANASSSRIVSNSLRGVTGVGIRSEGGGPNSDVSGNRITETGNDAIQIETTDTTVTRNRIRFAGLRGLFVRASGAMLSRNTVIRSGNGCLAAFEVFGDNNELERNSAVRHRGDGFYVEGTANSLDGCRALRCTEDGFDLQSGTDNELNRCAAVRNGAEGLDNSATNTSESLGRYIGNRLDVGNDGSFSSLGGRFRTGGEGAPPEVDCDDSERGDRW